jgi:hypothetical protein
VNGVPHVQSREFDEFAKYVGSSPDDIDHGLPVFSGTGLCPNIIVGGVPLQYNDSHEQVMVKIKHLGQQLNNFGDQLPVGADIPVAQRLQALRAEAFRQARQAFVPYWEQYNTSMSALKDTTQRAEYQFVPLPRHASANLLPSHRMYLDLLLDVSEAHQYCDAKLANTTSKPVKGTEAAAAHQLREAVALHGQGATLRAQFQPSGLKYLRFVRAGRARADVMEWKAANARVGDLILVKMDNQEQPWELAIVLDPATGKDNPRAPALHVPAGLQGREKVRLICHGLHGTCTSQPDRPWLLHF